MSLVFLSLTLLSVVVALPQLGDASATVAELGESWRSDQLGPD